MPINRWRVEVQGKIPEPVEGQPVTEQPKEVLTLKGPVDPMSVVELAQNICNAQRRRAIRAGFPDPELKVVSVQPQGEDLSPPGHFAPPGHRPVDLDAFAKELVKRPAPELKGGTTSLGAPAGAATTEMTEIKKGVKFKPAATGETEAEKILNKK